MAGRTPGEAHRNYIAPLQEALHCITAKRLTLPKRLKFGLDTVYSANLADMDPVPLAGAFPLLFTAGQVVRIVRVEDEGDERGPFKVQTVSYLYAFSTPAGGEILGFHWTPEAKSEGAVTFPHLHVGPAILGTDLPVRPGDFHKAHIPTQRVSIESVIRLAIDEFRVRPLRKNWRSVLERTEGALLRWRTRPG